MNKLKYFLLMCLILVGLSINSFGAVYGELTPYTVALTTYAITNATYIGAQISGNARVREIWLTNSSSTTAQTITFYELATSTTTATLKFTIHMAPGTTVWKEDIADVGVEYWLATDMCMRKTDTGSTVNAVIWYN